MSDALQFDAGSFTAEFPSGNVDVPTATAILVGIALAALIGMRLTFPKG